MLPTCCACTNPQNGRTNDCPRSLRAQNDQNGDSSFRCVVRFLFLAAISSLHLNKINMILFEDRTYPVWVFLYGMERKMSSTIKKKKQKTMCVCVCCIHKRIEFMGSEGTALFPSEVWRVFLYLLRMCGAQRMDHSSGRERERPNSGGHSHILNILLHRRHRCSSSGLSRFECQPFSNGQNRMYAYLLKNNIYVYEYIQYSYIMGCVFIISNLTGICDLCLSVSPALFVAFWSQRKMTNKRRLTHRKQSNEYYYESDIYQQKQHSIEIFRM